MLGRAGWVLFDWANQPFFVLGAFVFAPYFSAELVGDPSRGQSLWGFMLAAVAITVAISSPILGAVADAVGRRKPWVAAFCGLTVVGALLMWFAAPGSQGAVLFALVVFAAASVGAELSAVFNNAMLPSLTSERRMGRLSGLGWGSGYAGGLIGLLAVLFVIILPETKPFGLDADTFEAERAVGPFSALWLVLFLIPFFVFTPDAPGRAISMRQATRDGIGRLVGTVRQVRKLSNVARFLVARMLYQDGLSALMSFAGLYGAGTFGWSIETVALFAIILMVTAIPGSFAGGLLDDWLGPKRTVTLSVAALMAAAVGILSVSPDTVLFVVDVAPAADGDAPFMSAAEQVFLAFGLLAGAFVGPAQSASRTLLAKLAPAAMMTEFFGLYALSGKATAFVAPLAIGVITAATGEQRLGLIVIAVLLAGGLALLPSVKVERATLTVPHR